MSCRGSPPRYKGKIKLTDTQKAWGLQEVRKIAKEHPHEKWILLVEAMCENFGWKVSSLNRTVLWSQITSFEVKIEK